MLPAADAMSRKQRRSPRPSAKGGRTAKPAGERPPADSKPPASKRLFPFLLLVVGTAIYWPAVSGPFVFDDSGMLEAAGAAREADFQNWLRTGRPLLYATFWLSYRLTGGFTPTTWFHLPNIILHALNAILLWWFWRSICGLESMRSQLSEALRKWLIYGAPLLFLALPIQTEAAAYISSRSDVLSTTFYLAALCLFASPLRLRRRGLTAVGLLLLAGMAALTKQDKVTLPAAILLLDYLILSGRDWKGVARSWLVYASLALAGAVGFFAVVRPFLFAESAGFRLDWTTYLFTQFRMYFLYLKLVFAPFGLNLDHDIAPSADIFEHGAWLAMAALAAAAAGAVYWRRKFPLPSFSVLLFFLTMAPTGSFFPLLDFAAERRMYLPLAGLLPAAFFLLDRYARIGPKAVTPILIALGAVYGAATFQRAALWGDGLALWQDAAEKSPQKARPWMWLGKAQDERGLTAEARRSWLRAAEVAKPGSEEMPAIFMNLGLSFARQKNYAQAVEYYKPALRANPENPVGWAQLAVARMRLGRAYEGRRDFEKAFEYGGGHRPEVLQLRGQEYFLAGRCEEAASDFLQASRQIPEDETLRRNLEAARRCAAQAQEER